MGCSRLFKIIKCREHSPSLNNIPENTINSGRLRVFLTFGAQMIWISTRQGFSLGLGHAMKWGSVINKNDKLKSAELK